MIFKVTLIYNHRDFKIVMEAIKKCKNLFFKKIKQF